MAEAVLPRVHTLLLCDHLEPAPGEEGVYNLFGVRTKIEASTFPHVHPQLYVYLQVTGHAGQFSGSVVGVSARTDEALFQKATPPLTLVDPLTFVPVVVPIQDCEFPESGIYYFQVFFGQKLVYERPLHLIESRETTDGQQRA